MYLETFLPLLLPGLRRAALLDQEEYGMRPKQFVTRNFYVDNGLTSFSTDDNAIQVMKKTKEMLAESNIQLHKFASNHNAVIEAFPP